MARWSVREYVHVLISFTMSTSADDESYTLESVVRGHHVYMNHWTPAIGQILEVHQEEGNAHDRFAVATSRGESVVGHLPIEFSKLAWYFLQHGGHIVCEITGSRRRSDVLNKGLVVPCTYTFSGKPKIMKRLRKEMDQKKLTK